MSRPTLPAIELDGDTLFFTKSRAWEYEKEWRIILPLQEASLVLEAKPRAIHLFDFPKEAVRQVILGTRTSPELKEEIVSAAIHNCGDVEILHTVMDQNEYGLQLKPWSGLQ